MKNVWVLVADNAVARIFEKKNRRSKTTLLKKILNPSGKLRDREIRDHRPGRSFDSFRRSRHSMEPHTKAKVGITRRFASDLALLLEKGRREEKYDRLILISAPKFLGSLRDFMDAKTSQLVISEMHRDLTKHKTNDIDQVISEVL